MTQIINFISNIYESTLIMSSSPCKYNTSDLRPHSLVLIASALLTVFYIKKNFSFIEHIRISKKTQ